MNKINISAAYCLFFLGICFLSCVRVIQGEENSNASLMSILEGHNVDTSPTTNSEPYVSPLAPSFSHPPTTDSSAIASFGNTKTFSKYIIATGDTLIDIADKLLGDGSRYPEIVELNKNKFPSLANNPDLIFPKWELELPPNKTSPSSPTRVTIKRISSLVDTSQIASSASSPQTIQPSSDDKTISDIQPTSGNTDQNLISDQAKQQMSNVVNYAKTHNNGASRGNCFAAVWGYLTSSGYGNLHSWGDLPNMESGEARNFAEYLNAGQSNLDEAGLIRYDSALNPPITNPHDSRIPAGAVIVVSAGSYGTAHPTAGDIVVKSDDGNFINDGPDMDYGTSSTWYGKILGVYIPK
ncbi:MAG: LysM peptidoglycan-binding domain-containing protein [Candidatus Riflebacteria bacterium]|nr:LysM peptidoglycan-binding domain-containing protein [Candidatus Riflebacteria bacterium]